MPHIDYSRFLSSLSASSCSYWFLLARAQRKEHDSDDTKLLRGLRPSYMKKHRFWIITLLYVQFKIHQPFRAPPDMFLRSIAHVRISAGFRRGSLYFEVRILFLCNVLSNVLPPTCIEYRFGLIVDVARSLYQVFTRYSHIITWRLNAPYCRPAHPLPRGTCDFKYFADACLCLKTRAIRAGSPEEKVSARRRLFWLLSQGLPQQFAEYLAYCRSLKFDAKPNVPYLQVRPDTFGNQVSFICSYCME